jgi:uncharacterized protein GlcG (DUF336 family)
MRLRSMLAGAAIVMATAVPAHAQLRSVSVISAQAAAKAIAAAQAEATKNGWNVSITVVDPNGDLVAFARMDAAPISSIDVSLGKARTAARFRRVTRYYDSVAVNGRPQVMGLPGVTPIEGGVPVVVNGAVVGAIGVSGATSAQDAQCATAGAATVTP